MPPSTLGKNPENPASYTPLQIVDAALHLTNLGFVERKKLAKITETYRVV